MAIPKELLPHVSPFPKGTEKWQPKQNADGRVGESADGTSADTASLFLKKPREVLSLRDVNKLLQDRKPLRRGVRIRDR